MLKYKCICDTPGKLHPQCKADEHTPPAKEKPLSPSDATDCSSVGGDFYQGVEWLACWLLDNVEGETITEEQLRPWAQKAWLAHMDRKNDKTLPTEGAAKKP